MAFLGIVFASIQFIRAIINGSIISFIFALLILIPCAYWLSIRNNAIIKLIPQIQPSNNIFRIFMISFFSLYTISILSLFFRENLFERPFSFFILLAIMAGILVVEIISSKETEKYQILIQIIFMGLLLGWSQLLITPSLIGIDPWWHQMFATNIQQIHFIPEGYGYSNFPIFHLFTIITSFLTQFGYKYSVMSSVGLMQIICNTLFIYLFGIFLFKNYKIGLLASFFLIIGPYQVYMNYISIPNSFAPIFILIILYILLKLKINLKNSLILSILMFSLILTHTISAFFLAIILFVCWGSFALYDYIDPNNKEKFPISIPIIYSFAMLLWWTYDHSTIMTFADIILNMFKIDYFMIPTPESLITSLQKPGLEQIFKILGLFIFLYIPIAGIFYMVSDRGTRLTFTIAIIGIFTILILNLSFLLGLPIIPDRWFYYSEIFLSIPLAITIVLNKKTDLRFKSGHFIVTLFFVIFLTFLAIMNPIANSDNMKFSPEKNRISLSESEIKAGETVSYYAQMPLISDRFYSNSLHWSGINATFFDDEIYYRDYAGLTNKITLVRNAILTQDFWIYSTTSKLDYNLNRELEHFGLSRIYDSHSVKAYL